MPRGGARVGSGPKPRSRPFDVIEGGAQDAAEKIQAPEDMTPDQAGYWKQYAPLAVERRTLTSATVPSFRLLCELLSELKAVKATIDKDGRTYIKVTVDGAGTEHEELKAHPLKADFAKLAKQVETLMGRFLLAPFGKPLVTAKPKSQMEKNKAMARSAFFGVSNG